MQIVEKDHKKQIEVANDIATQIPQQAKTELLIMIESNLVEWEKSKSS